MNNYQKVSLIRTHIKSIRTLAEKIDYYNIKYPVSARNERKELLKILIDIDDLMFKLEDDTRPK